MIKSFRHKRLAAFYRDGKTKGLQQGHIDRLEIILSALDRVSLMPEDMAAATFRTHKLQGDMKEYWSVRVNGNWRVIFRFVDGDVMDVDLIDYH